MAFSQLLKEDISIQEEINVQTGKGYVIKVLLEVSLQLIWKHVNYYINNYWKLNIKKEVSRNEFEQFKIVLVSSVNLMIRDITEIEMVLNCNCRLIKAFLRMDLCWL